MEQAEKTESEDTEIVKPEDQQEPEIVEGAEPEEKPEDEQAEGDDVEITLTGEDETPPSTLPKGFKRRLEREKRKTEESKTRADAVAQENELLKVRLKQLEQSRSEPAKRPALVDYDYDEDKHAEALDEYYRTLARREVEQVTQSSSQEREQSRQQEQRQAQLQDSLKSHYKRAEELGVKDFEETEDAVFDVFGDKAASELIASAGDNSHKLMYWLGKNPGRAQAIWEKLQNNPAAALIELGTLTSKLEIRNKRQPAPAPDPKMDGAPSGGTDWQKRIDKMREKVSSGEATMREVLDLKRQAREAGANL